ncbi:MAG: GNAT family N-acetyltransferase [Bowdeniella nasicola]|nr:GNAT family N-acetyltransferase [Bowdeniella nasicola]
MIRAQGHQFVGASAWYHAPDSYLVADRQRGNAIVVGRHAADLLACHLDEAITFVRAEPATPDTAGAILTARGFELLGDWVWMYSDTPPPPQPGESNVTVMDLPPAERLSVQARCNPDTHVAADDDTWQWWGYNHREAGWVGLCAAEKLPARSDRRYCRGAGVSLAGLGVDPQFRRSGIGSALMAAVTRHYLTIAPVVHYGVWLTNTPALRAYRLLGVCDGQLVRGWRKPAAAASRLP